MTTTTSPSPLPEIAADRFDADVVDASRTRPVVVDFWAPWCAPCHQLAPVLERVAARHADDVDAVKLNVDQAPQVAQRHRIQGIPAIKAFSGGRVVAELTGVQPEQALEQLFASLAPSEADRLVAAAESAGDASARERQLQAALEADPGHRAAALALARLLADRGDVDEARALLGRLPEDAEIARLRAELDLASAGVDDAELARLEQAAEAGDAQAALTLGRALAARAEHEQALQRLLQAVRDPAAREDARSATLEVFAVLGDDHELVRRARPRLASALF